MDRELLRSFISAIDVALRHVLKTVAGVQLQLQSTRVVAQLPQQNRIVGMVQLTSPKVNGRLLVAFEPRLFVALMCVILGERLTSIPEDLQDGAAELTNMILGQLKREFGGTENPFSQSIPTALTTQVGTSIPIQGKAVLMEFQCPQGAMEVCFIPRE